jgi:type III secretion system FlhB-like substrate exporter
MMEASISAIRAADTGMAVSAHNVANMMTKEARAQRVAIQEQPNLGGVRAQVQTTDQRPDLMHETAVQIATDSYFQGNMTALKTQNDMMGQVIDLMA